jgi:hypothetical protein
MNANQVDHSAEDDAVRRAYQATREAAGGSAVDAAFPDEPPASVDNAIRAAARRAVHARPQAVGKSWFTRYRTPLSAAAVVMLSASLVMVAFNERADLRPDSPIVAAVPVPAAPAEPAKRDTGITFDKLANEAPINPPMVKAEMVKTPVVMEPIVTPKEKKSPPAVDEARKATQQLAEAAQSSVPQSGTNRLREASPSMASSAATTQGPAGAISDKPAPLPVPAPPPSPKAMMKTVSPSVAPTNVLAEPRLPMAAAPAPQSPAAAGPAPAPATVARASGVAAAKPDSGRREQDTFTGETRASDLRADSKERATEPVTDQQSMQGWIARLTSLKRAGKEAELRASLAQFRKIYPRSELPKELADFESAIPKEAVKEPAKPLESDASKEQPKEPPAEKSPS